MINLRGRGSDTPTASTSEHAGAQKVGERALDWFPGGSTRAPGRGVPGTQGGCLPSPALQTGVGRPRSTRRGAEPLPWAVEPHWGGWGAPKLALRSLPTSLNSPSGRARRRGPGWGQGVVGVGWRGVGSVVLVQPSDAPGCSDVGWQGGGEAEATATDRGQGGSQGAQGQPLRS